MYKAETKVITADYEVNLEDVGNFDKPGQFITVTNVGANSVGLQMAVALYLPNNF